ncbi:DUF503 domain-containing protein [Proteiniclasticum sp. QWL-01]|uniref:DUF503 domain-containing protein n=1 Tax=Proteiniclasticum sp. QWL-01 TaxID=3036945 RepID=UPI00220169D2|nr:DUF503 domain-containing protein [Proteiniclasticum sp. QWL-01]UUM12646.1 DUF503 domain-containing protein [Clostridiaceae bacterium HFYG-1003]WFF74197.1 DUF503 domain-containing protein [Proteiniclasticum sp. QWL-01]
MVIACGVFRLKLHTAYSLKDKRMVTKSIIDRVRNKFNASCSETGLNDSIRDIEISISVINSSKVVAENEAARISDYIYNHAEAELIGENIEIIYI